MLAIDELFAVRQAVDTSSDQPVRRQPASQAEVLSGQQHSTSIGTAPSGAQTTNYDDCAVILAQQSH